MATPIILQAQNNDQLQEELQKVRKELIAEIDRKLEQVKRELVEEIDRQLQFAQPAGFMGVTLKPITSGLRTLLDLNPGEGVLITKVELGGPADSAGIKEMDIILKVNGKAIGSVEKLEDLIAQSGAGAELQLSILHRREQKTVSVKLGIARASKRKSTSVFDDLLGKKGIDGKSLKNMEKKLKRFLGKMSPEDKKMMENMQKQLKKQMDSLLKDPKARKNMEKQFKSILEQFGNKDFEDMVKDLMPKNSPKTGKQDTKDEIDSLLDDLLEESKPATTPKAYHGMSIISIPAAVREKEDFFEDYGILVSDVAVGSPAVEGGVKKWDILLYIEKRKILSLKEAEEILAGYNPGDKVALTLLSNGERRTVMVTFAQKPK